MVDIEELKRLAQPAEAEGAGLRAMSAGEWAERAPSRNVVLEDEAIAALSAVTAERDSLREERDSQQRVCIAEMEKVNQLRAEVEALRVLLIDARELIEHGDFREGHCMCGSAVDGHTFGDGHTPCDAGEYYAGQVRERIDAAMAAKEGK